MDTRLTRRLLLSGAGIGALGLLGGCGSSGPAASGPGGPQADPDATLRWQIAYFPVVFDPHRVKNTGDGGGLRWFYNRLVHRDNDGNALPGLAESWQVADDLKSITFKLLKGLKFGDGTPFTSEVVKANIQRAKTPASIAAPALRPVEGVDTPDEHTAVVRTPGGAPMALILILSDTGGMMVNPKAFATPEKEAELAKQPDGISAWKLVKYTVASHYEMEATPDYWDPEQQGTKRFVVDVVADPETRMNALRGGQADLASGSPSMYGQAEASGLKAPVRVNWNLYALGLHRSRGVFATKALREAVLHAIERKPVVTALEGYAEEAEQFSPVGLQGYSDKLKGRYPFDLEKAKAKLREGGKPDGFEFDSIVLNLPDHVVIAQVLQQQLARVGIKMHLKAQPVTEATVNWIRGGTDATVNSYTYKPDVTQMMELYLGIGSNTPKWEPLPGMAEAITAANKERDPKKRSDLLAQVMAVIMDHAAFAPLAHYKLSQVVTSRVIGYEPSRTLDEFRGVKIAKS